MGGNPQLASWLVARRRAIDERLAHHLGSALPAAASGEAEALRRFRSFALAALLQGREVPPALDGLRVQERRTSRLLEAWVDAAAEMAGPDASAVRDCLSPLLARFRAAMRATSGARRRSGAPRASNRRAVSAAIDRVADAFLAIDTDTALIADANPAAGALLGTSRDGLVGESALRWIPEPERDLWWTQLDAMAEGGEAQRFHATFLDDGGAKVAVDARLTRFATRARTLALLLARPV